MDEQTGEPGNKGRAVIDQYIDHFVPPRPRQTLHTIWLHHIGQANDGRWMVLREGWHQGWRPLLSDHRGRKVLERECDEGFSVAERPPAGLEKFKELPLEISLDSFQECARGFDLMSSLTGVRSLGNNPLLATTWRGWEVLVPTICVLKMIAAPSERVLQAVCSPAQGLIRLNTNRSAPDTVVLTATDPLLLHAPTARELECLAFWLATPGYRRALQLTYASTQLVTKIQLPDIPARIALQAEGLTDRKRILVNRFRLKDDFERATWPRTWSKVVLEDDEGNVRHVAAADRVDGAMEKVLSVPTRITGCRPRFQMIEPMLVKKDGARNARSARRPNLQLVK